MGLSRPQTNLCSERHLPRTGSTNSQTDRDGTNGVVLQMGVPLGGWGLTMSEHLADEVEAVAARYGDRGEAVPKVMNATSSSPAVARTRCQGSGQNIRTAFLAR